MLLCCVALSLQLTQSARLLRAHVVPQSRLKVHRQPPLHKLLGASHRFAQPEIHRDTPEILTYNSCCFKDGQNPAIWPAQHLQACRVCERAAVVSGKGGGESAVTHDACPWLPQEDKQHPQQASRHLLAVLRCASIASVASRGGWGGPKRRVFEFLGRYGFAVGMGCSCCVNHWHSLRLCKSHCLGLVCALQQSAHVLIVLPSDVACGIH